MIKPIENLKTTIKFFSPPINQFNKHRGLVRVLSDISTTITVYNVSFLASHKRVQSEIAVSKLTAC